MKSTIVDGLMIPATQDTETFRRQSLNSACHRILIDLGLTVTMARTDDLDENTRLYDVTVTGPDDIIDLLEAT